jgi:hypothetical protein
MGMGSDIVNSYPEKYCARQKGTPAKKKAASESGRPLNPLSFCLKSRVL